VKKSPRPGNKPFRHSHFLLPSGRAKNLTGISGVLKTHSRGRAKVFSNKPKKNAEHRRGSRREFFQIIRNPGRFIVRATVNHGRKMAACKTVRCHLEKVKSTLENAHLAGRNVGFWARIKKSAHWKETGPKSCSRTITAKGGPNVGKEGQT